MGRRAARRGGAESAGGTGAVSDSERIRRLLLLGLREDPEDRRKAFSGLTPEDWRELLDRWNDHRLLPLVHVRLGALEEAGVVPAEAAERLARRHEETLEHNRGIRRQVAGLADLFGGGDPPLVLIKGLHLNETIHGDLGIRELWDIDVLVRRKDLARVQERMFDAGYGPRERPSIEEQCAEHRHLVPFRHPQGVAPVEVHWTIETREGPFRVDPEGLVDRAVSEDIRGIRIRVLSPEDLLLYLCLRAAWQDHFAAGLRSLFDVRGLLVRYAAELRAETLIERARRWRCTKCLFLTLSLARQLFGAPVPAEWLEEIRPADFRREYLDWSEERIFVQKVDRHRILSPTMARAAAESSAAKRAGIVLRRVFPAPADLARMNDLPPRSPRVAAYYPVRIVDLIRRRGRMAWRLGRGDPEARDLARRVQRREAVSRWIASEEG